MRCEREGDGPVVVLLPALGCDGRMWEPVTKLLRDRFTLVRPETWNCGTLQAAAQGTAALLTSLGIAQAGVAGVSMGGYLAFELLRLWPQGIRAAALLDTTAFPDTPERQRTRQQVLRMLREGRFEEVLAPFVASVLAPTRARGGPEADLLRLMARELGAGAFANDVDAIARRGSYEDVLRAVRVPLVFLVGEHDGLTPPEVAHRMASAVPGSRVEVVPDAGHMAALENPEAVARALGTFFGRVFGSR